MLEQEQEENVHKTCIGELWSSGRVNLKTKISFMSSFYINKNETLAKERKRRMFFFLIFLFFLFGFSQLFWLGLLTTTIARNKERAKRIRTFTRDQKLRAKKYTDASDSDSPFISRSNRPW